MTTPNSLIFPFTAVLGQEELKNCLILTAVDPSISGVLALGDRGTAKTTIIRALGQLLTNHGLGMPVVELPLGSSEDRVLGTMDLQKALNGDVAFAPGILSRAHGGFLYIDEVNLLDDFLVDVLLDVSASGVNRVERDGISHTHAARFVLVGSGNPEEGDLRPQLKDRFGLATEVRTIREAAVRAEIARRRMLFDDDEPSFFHQWSEREEQVAQRILAARTHLHSVHTPPHVLQQIVEVCVESGAVGHRAEVVLARTARAIAALAGREEVTRSDVIFAAVPALQHRMADGPGTRGASASSQVKLTAARVLGLRAA
ncbi:ATP-binding protein [Nesterenkonia haasae]|uniref:ATP-binding protein n=1 Tax=Nesterenkonia haasae TaxID=2587813 RepID=UPI0013915362|nr:AAA family ATPase [Nesterenkonia haasae]NDK31437.1 magnesium chelatase ATPase subunit I [Nesterenkonia haasae]